MPTRAPQNVTYFISNKELKVSWLPLPVYFRGTYLKGYRVAAYKSGTLIDEWDQPATPPNATIAGVHPDDVDCVAVYGYTKYGNGFSSGCVVQGTI